MHPGSPTSLPDPRAPLPPLLLPEKPPLFGTPSQLRPLPLFHPRHPISFSGPSFPPPQPFPGPCVLLPPPPMHPACFGASDSTTNHHPHHGHTKPAPTAPGKGGKKQAAATPASTPSCLIFSTVAPSPNAGSKMGILPSPGGLSTAPEPAGADATSPLFSVLALFCIRWPRLRCV